ncbi:MAG: succinyl-diaminopimelate desuccinylase [Pseudomonadales bacterium]|nr:succinyl-diaminopimelate desuccinylase [Pseudomonadales bacterium]
MNNKPSMQTLELTKALLCLESVTPADAGCQKLIAKRLGKLNFAISDLHFGEVDNLWAIREGKIQKPLIVFAGHTDVVPTGPLSEWQSPPFVPSIRDGYLYGRGAADMKSSLAAMVVAVEKFVDRYPKHDGSIGFLITSDEEGEARDGTKRVIEHLTEQSCYIDYCIVGEPSSDVQLGDTVKCGRRGSLSGELIIRGKQGHVAYPHLAINPIHQAISALNKLLSQQWAAANQYFPATSLQVSNINAGTGAGNVIPGILTAAFNFRFNPEQNIEQLKAKTESIFSGYGLDYSIEWKLSGVPFITPEGRLTKAVRAAVQSACNITPQFSTSGGTSDGRFIAPTGTDVVEIGPVNATIHMIDERVYLPDLTLLENIYFNTLENLLINPSDTAPA